MKCSDTDSTGYLVSCSCVGLHLKIHMVTKNITLFSKGIDDLVQCSNIQLHNCFPENVHYNKSKNTLLYLVLLVIVKCLNDRVIESAPVLKHIKLQLSASHAAVGQFLPSLIQRIISYCKSFFISVSVPLLMIKITSMLVFRPVFPKALKSLYILKISLKRISWGWRTKITLHNHFTICQHLFLVSLFTAFPLIRSQEDVLWI